MDVIIVTLISSGCTLLGTILTIIFTTRKQASEMDKKIAVIETRMDNMTEDIKAHNQYAKMFSENNPAITQHMSDTDRRLDNIERKVMQ